MTEELNTEIEIAPATETAPTIDVVLANVLDEIKANVSTKTFVILENEIGKEEVKIVSINSNPRRSGALLLVALNTVHEELSKKIEELSKANEPVVSTPEAEILPPETV